MSEPDKTSREAAMDAALLMYAYEPCRICGESIKPRDLGAAVFAGYSAGDRSRSAHRDCWERGRPKRDWAYPEDAGDE